MGHLASKDAYRKLGQKIDGLATRAQWSPLLRAILEELYTEAEAELVVGMPYSLASARRIARGCKLDLPQAQRLLDDLCRKGLVIDLWSERSGRRAYAPSPMIIGIFEFTMMRTAAREDHRRRARLFRKYFESGEFYAANAAEGVLFPMARALTHDGTLGPAEATEILDHERAAAIVADASVRALGVCSCRHEKLHSDAKACDTPLLTCQSFGLAASYLIRNGLARAASRAEMLDLLSQSRERGLVLSADNVRKGVTFICHCCGCCCNLLGGITQHGYTSTIVTSGYLPVATDDRCKGCGQCAQACSIACIHMEPPYTGAKRKLHRPRIDAQLCIGCGVCATRCPTQALQLARREQRVLYPSSTLERVILQSLASGTLQNLIFDDPHSGAQRHLRALVGAFLRLSPVKQALMSSALRSTFLAGMTAVAKARDSSLASEL